MKIFAGERIIEVQSSDKAILTVPAAEFLVRSFATVNPSVGLYIYDISPNQIKAVQAKLTEFYGVNRQILLDNATIAVKDIQSGKDIFIEGTAFIERERYSFADLLEIMRRLRDDDGCPWDKAQTHQSIRGNAIEEAYELVEAIDLNDRDKMLEESGDVLLQGLFHGAIAEDNGEFSELDMVSALCKKLVDRHTHIFGANKANNPDDALKFWEQAKAVEKGQRSAVDKINCVPTTFSALMRASKVQKICKKTGFDFPNIEDAYAKILEEMEELQNATEAEREGEAGDLLFAVVNVIRMYHLDAELAINGSTNKFIRRFTYIEEQAKKAGVALTECSLETMEKWYKEYKALYENR